MENGISTCDSATTAATLGETRAQYKAGRSISMIHGDEFETAAGELSGILLKQRATHVRIGHLLAGYAPERAPRAVHVEKAVDRFAAALTPLIEEALRQAVRDDSEYLSSIRRFFISRQETYSIEELAAAWWVTPAFIADIWADELSAQNTTIDAMSNAIVWEDAAKLSVMFQVFRTFDMERALGSEFATFRSDAWRTIPTLLRLPKFFVDAAVSELAPRDEPLAARVERFLLEMYAADRRA